MFLGMFEVIIYYHWMCSHSVLSYTLVKHSLHNVYNQQNYKCINKFVTLFFSCKMLS